MTTVEDFKAELARLYRIALDHYGGDKTKARAAIEVYCRGLNQAPRRG